MKASHCMDCLADIYRSLDRLVDERDFLARPLRWYQKLALLFAFSVAFYGLGFLLPADGFIGFDWVQFFRGEGIPVWYPPWADLLIQLLNWPGLIAITLAAVGVSAYERSTHILSFLLVFFTLPLMWVLFLGQVDGLVVLGLLFLPISAPLALLKPQVAVFGFAARRSYLIALVVTMVGSFLIWGLWPLDMFSVWTIHQGRFVNDIAIGVFGLPVAVILLWLSRGDTDMLMLGGAFMTPYLLPYNLIVVVPAVARLAPRSAVIACILSWMPMLANWIGPIGWWLGWAFVLWLWISLAVQRYQEPHPKNVKRARILG
jgi:hypothetical protein